MLPPPPARASHVFFLPFVNRGSLALADGWFTKSNAVPRLNKSARPPARQSVCLKLTARRLTAEGTVAAAAVAANDP